VNFAGLTRRHIATAVLGALAGILADSCPAKPTPSPTPMQQTMSNSGFFAVYGLDAQARMAVARRADQLLASWNATTGLDPEWKWPVVVNGQIPSAGRPKSPATNLYVGDGDTLKIQVDMPSTFLGTSDFDIAIIRALALEYAYRKAGPKAGKSYNRPPAWFIEGVWQETAASEGGLSAALFERLLRGAPPPRLDVFLKQRPELMDPTSRAVYRAQALGLLRALISSAEGKEGLGTYLSSLPGVRPEDSSGLLTAFPSIAKDPSILAKFWTLSLARASSGDSAEFLDAAESGKRLAAIFKDVRLPADEKSKSGEGELRGAAALPGLARTAAGRFTLKGIAEDLLRLEARAHPLYRPVVEEYREIAAELSKKARRDAAKRIAAASELLSALDARSEAIADHLNWFEATRMDTPSEAFQRGPEVLLTGVPKRSDQISSTLDTVEKTLSRK